MATHLFTSESVTIGHPDKLADQISDSVLDAILEQDPNGRVAAETLLGKGLVVLAGEITTEAYVNIEEIVRKTIINAGYTDARYGLDGHSVGVLNAIIPQSPEIAKGVFNSLEARTGSVDRYDLQGAGDQGIIFGFANNDNTSFYPAAGKIAHLITDKLRTERESGAGNAILLPDGKSQITLRYKDNIPIAIETVLISTQHHHSISLKTLEVYVIEHVIQPVIEAYNAEAYGAELVDEKNYIINPAGEWNVGGSGADTGLTGRKITVDTYAGYARHGGGCFSGKDPSKVDRSAAYYLRYAAKNLVAAGVAEELELQVSYAIGKANPVSLYVDTRNKPNIGANVILGIINELFDFRPLAIIEQLKLKNPIFYPTAQNGHFGRDFNNSFTWEHLNKVEEIKNFLK